MGHKAGKLVLTETAERLLKIIKDGGSDWMCARDIAVQIRPDRTRLYADEAAVLDLLAANGVIEKEERRQRAIMMSVYRMPQNG